MSIIRIDMPKGVEEGSTSVAPKSPVVSGTSSPPISRKGAVLIGTSINAARTVYSTLTQEIRAGGNEELATSMENATTALGIAVGAYVSGGLTLIPQAISTASTLVSRERNNARVNRARTYERSMRGERQTYGQGGGYE